VYGIVEIKTADDVRTALEFARANHLKVSVAGQRHSMGGQTFTNDGLVLDMRNLSAISLDRDRKVVHVQSGATWAQIQQLIDKEGLSIQAMQSINVFTIGGSLSVNAHGIAHRPGPVASTVQSMRIMLTNGEIRNASQTENSELFRLVLGGYGLFGVILDADIQLVDNEIYSLETHELDFRQFPAYYRTHVAEDDSVGLMYGRISISPTSYLRETAIHIYRKTDFWTGQSRPSNLPLTTALTGSSSTSPKPVPSAAGFDGHSRNAWARSFMPACRATKRRFKKMRAWFQETKK
jgi:FAD/FMN-containing dehydrogenase